ncbi:MULTISPECIES: Wadjet anti-phage system protein JetD domain-containing protein [Sporolactobacillus]|uniref:Wadjet anti-phage system protein JetD domain-containing protein n=1 Tax=Sporolactobacillus TaxID=2077 RepID=UPI003183DCB6
MTKRLTEFSKKTIELGELEKLLTPFFQTYETFADRILQFEKENVLIMVRSTGRTTRTPSLALKYRINKSALSGNYHKELQRYRAKLHTAINLDGYYRADPSLWEKHLPYLLKIDRYLKTHGFPTDLVPAPERSYELVEDEKWIDEKGGKELLEKIGLYARLTIIPVSDPLMFAINPLKLNEKEQYHLIVENKTTYQGLLPVLKETDCATLIYGCGKAVVKSIEQFPMQYPISAKHHFLYFGDLDREGLSIWYSLNQKQAARPALPFYQACLKKAPAVGKAYQRSRSVAEDQFLACFSEQQAERIRTMLHDGKYYPQEILKTRELQHIWRGTDWKSLICAKS